MKNLLNNVVAGLLLTVLIASCSTSSDVASNSRIQKRKYTKGYHIDKATKSKPDVVKQEETFTAQKTVTPSQEEATIPAITVTPDVAENNTVVATEMNAPEKSKTKLKEKGFVDKAFAKADEHKELSKEASHSFKMSDTAATGIASPLGIDVTTEINMWLRYCLIFVLVAIIFSIIGSIAGGFILYPIAGICALIAAVFAVLWLIEVLG